MTRYRGARRAAGPATLAARATRYRGRKAAKSC
jgi:hypothetical protein